MKPLYIKKNGSINKVAGIAMPGTYPSEKVSYDNTESGIEATDAQGAIDEISSRIDTLKSDIANHIETTDMASRDYEAGDVFIMANGHLVKALNDIDEDTTISASDVEDITVTELLAEKADITDLNGKADKVTSAVDGNFAGLDSNGNLTDSGHKHSDYLTQHQDISGKADKVTGATNGNLAGLDTNGNLADAGWASDKTTTSATGNPISISGLKSNQLAINPVITFEPIQAGSGTPSPSNVRAISGYDKVEFLSCGKNIWDEQWEVGYYDPSTGNPVAGNANLRSKNSNPMLAVGNKTYYWCCPRGGRVFCYDANNNYIENIDLSNSYVTFTTPANTVYMRFHIATEYGTTYQNNISINYPSTDNQYHPYHKTTDLSESLGQTVYGGTLDVRTGKATVTYGYKDLGDLTWTRNGFGSIYAFESSSITDRASHVANGICEKYSSVAKSVANLENYEIVLHGSNGKIYIRDDNYTDSTTFKNSLSGVKLVYELATPITIQLTPHEISLLKDYTYVSTNGTNMSFSYHNGELASLGDVAQLGQTVNELGVHNRMSFNDIYNFMAQKAPRDSLYGNQTIASIQSFIDNNMAVGETVFGSVYYVVESNWEGWAICFMQKSSVINTLIIFSSRRLIYCKNEGSGWSNTVMYQN